ncbi:MAG TPA: hypothetical protein VNG93_01950 [Candidatus Dormibacteraeota bacterium]|nr:hypothetical protein [Candidatus Dormibacteraeota bacterium]
MPSAIAGHSQGGISWPTSFMTSSSAPGTAAAISSPLAKGISGSASPWTTRTGIRSPASAGRRDGAPTMALNWRAEPSGYQERSIALAARACARSSSKLGPQVTRVVSTVCRIRSSRVAGGGSTSRRATSGSAWTESSPPRLDITMLSVSTFSGCSTATSWAIMPPIEAPATCAARIPSASRRPAASPAMSPRV